jgi:steroid delta-isomerase-like uncharacterized protein
MTTSSPSTEENKLLITALFDAYNEHDLEKFVALHADDAYIHGAGEDFDGIERIRSFARGQFEAFPNGAYHIQDLFAAEDRVAVRLTFTGTHDQTFFGVEPTGQEITVTEIAVYRIMEGRVAEMWLEADLWGMFQQVGAVDSPEG